MSSTLGRMHAASPQNERPSATPVLDSTRPAREKYLLSREWNSGDFKLLSEFKLGFVLELNFSVCFSFCLRLVKTIWRFGRQVNDFCIVQFCSFCDRWDYESCTAIAVNERWDREAWWRIRWAVASHSTPPPSSPVRIRVPVSRPAAASVHRYRSACGRCRAGSLK